MDVHESDEAENPRSQSNQAESNEGNRHGKSKSSWGLSTAVHAVHGVGFVAKKVINNRLTDSLWHTRKSSSSSSGPSDASDTKRENHSHETVDHHTSQPSVNVEDEQSPKLNESGKPTHERENTPLKGSNVNSTGSDDDDQLDNLKPQDDPRDSTTDSDVVDRSENTKPADGSHVKPVNQHRWPSSSTSGSTVWPSTTVGNSKQSASSHGRQANQHRWPRATSSNVGNQSENLEPSDGSHARPVNQHRWPGTVGSNVLNKSINHLYEASRVPKLSRKAFQNYANKPLPESSTDATNIPSSSLVDDGRLKIDKAVESQPSSPHKSHALASRTRAFTPARAVKPSHIVRGASLTPATEGANDTTTTKGASLLPATRGVSPSPATIEANSTTAVRGSSPMPSERGVSPPPPHDTVSSPSKRGQSPGPSRWSSHPTRGVSPTPTREVGHHARDVSPPSGKPSKTSARRHFFSANILSVFTKIVDTRKEKHVTSLKEVAQHLELLYNIQVQWQFANASAEAALELQRETAEKSLFDVWRATLELRDSLASKKIDIAMLILQLKLYAVLYRQMAYIDEWASIQKEHESALFATTNDLQARSLSLPITGGVKADIKGLKLIVFSTIQVLQATISCIQSTLSKLDKTHSLASELANLVLHERALLDECEMFLASAAPLHIEECSLRSYLLQSNRTSMTE